MDFFASCLKYVDMGFGSQAFGSLIGLVLFLMFGFGTFKFLQVGGLFKGSNLAQLLFNFGGETAYFISRHDFGNSNNYNAVSPKCGLSGVFDQRTIIPCKCIADSFLYNLVAKKAVQSGSDDRVNNVEELVDLDEDEEVDVASLRALVKAQRARAESALEELERERVASASAAQEALAMILLLQMEKSRVEMEGNHYRRMAEERHDFVEGIVEALQFTVAAQKDEIRRLEQELRARLSS